MASIASLLDSLGSVAPWSGAAGWDSVGLQVGDPERRAELTAVCHEVTDRVVAEALAARIDLLITYHPLLFRPIDRLVSGANPAGRALALATVECGVAAVHTNFDVAPGGSADSLAAAIGLEDTSMFGLTAPTAAIKVVAFVPAESVSQVRAAMAAAGAGAIGDYESCAFVSFGEGRFVAGSGTNPAAGKAGVDNLVGEARLEMVAPADAEGAVVQALIRSHPYEQPAFDVYDVRSNQTAVGRIGSIEPMPVAKLAERVGSVLQSPAVRVAAVEEVVAEVAVVPGAGGDLTGPARAAGADVLVTGDVSHHRAVTALDSGLAVIDAGHIPTERPGLEKLATLVSGLDTELVDLTGVDVDPWGDR